VPFLFIPRTVGLWIMGVAEPYTCVADNNPANDTPNPAPGTDGNEVEAIPEFDGWGYAYQCENASGKMRRVDSYAITEALSRDYANDFGDLSIHEFATDPTEYLAYSSYYSGGMRVFSFGPGGLVEQGRFIDDEGSNFWGVEQFTGADGERYFAGSDRDFGLQIFRYTGPGAAQRPVCSRGGTGDDLLAGGAARDRMFGEGGDDRLYAGAGSRNLPSDGAGKDRLFAANGERDRVNCGRGRYVVRADASDRIAGDCESVARRR
jgi:RTX calcium-binding nonapeptide repeat (4 copies)